MAYKLVHQQSGDEVKIGARVWSFRGEEAIVTGFAAPRHSGSTGRIYVRENGHETEYYPGVFGCKIVEA